MLPKKHLAFLYPNEQVENIFTPPSFVSFRAVFSLRKHLIRAKVYPLLRECGSSRCNKSRCQTFLNLKNTDVFRSFVTKKSQKINYKFYCDSKCFIYLFSCKTCGLQYIGCIVEKFRFRWNFYKTAKGTLYFFSLYFIKFYVFF